MKNPPAFSSGRLSTASKSVTVGFSGGIDSTATLLLMKQRFKTVIASTMWLYDGHEVSFDQIKAQSDALDVPHRILDFRKAFQDEVVAAYLRAYEGGFTPNPCIICNRMMKYGLLFDAIDTDYLALGHYARKVCVEGEWRIYRSFAARKDQSYNLYSLTQNQLARVLFPLGEFSSKDAVRAYCRTHFPGEIMAQPESMGACFLNGKAHYDYLKSVHASAAQSGYFVDRFGNILGVHEGVSKYTIGQKPRIKKEHPVDGMTSPYKVLGVVCGLDVEKREVVIGEEADVLANRIHLANFNIISGKRRAQLSNEALQRDLKPDFAREGHRIGYDVPAIKPEMLSTAGGEEIRASKGLGKSLRVEVRLSQWSEVYSGRCWIEKGGRNEKRRDSCENAANGPRLEEPRLIFESDSAKPMRAPAPGQAAVLYIGEELIGGGTIVYSNFPSSKSS